MSSALFWLFSVMDFVTIWSIVWSSLLSCQLIAWKQYLYSVSCKSIEFINKTWQFIRGPLDTFPQVSFSWRLLALDTAKLSHYKQILCFWSWSMFWVRVSGHLTAAAPPGVWPPQACSAPCSDQIWSNSVIPGEIMLQYTLHSCINAAMWFKFCLFLWTRLPSISNNLNEPNRW